MVCEFDSRVDIDVTTFFLRTTVAPHDDWGRFQIVDDLRTHPISRVLAMISDRLSGWFKGWMLRRWLRDAAPDVVLMDDGLGERIVKSISSRPMVVVRPNAEPPATADLEPPPLREADLVLLAAAEDVESPESLASGYLVDAQRLAALVAPARVTTRQRWSVPANEPLLIGWGPDPWLDGTSLFIRTLWYLQHRHETPVHGAWLGLSPGTEALEELEREVERCHLTGRVHFQERNDETTRLAGDAIYLPHRTESDLSHVVDAIACGNTVVGFAPAALDDPSFLTVSPLDLDGASTLLAVALREDPQRRLDSTMRLDVERWVSTFIDVVDHRAAQIR